MKTSKLIVFLLVLVVFLMPLTLAGFISDLLEKLKITGKAETSTVGLNISIGNTAPTIPIVEAITSPSITEGSITNISFYFRANDSDGAANLDSTTARANFSKSEEGLRQNLSCMYSHDTGTLQRQYNCTIAIWYWDGNGDWNITVAIADLSSAWAQNTSTTFNLGSTTSIASAPTMLTWSGVNPGSVNKTPSNTPLHINNTGNYNVSAGNIQITAINLLGEQTPSKALYAGNFSVGTSTGSSAECAAASSTLLVNGTPTGIAGSMLPRGNISAGGAQEDMYFCLRLAGSELTSQAYSTARGGTWTIGVV